MAEEAKQAQIKFKVSADGAKEAADGLERVTQVLERQNQVTKSMSGAAELSGYLSRLAAYREEAAKVNAVQDQTVETLTRISKAANDNSAKMEINSKAVKENAARFAELGGTVANAFAQVSPAVAQFQGVLDPVLRSLSGTLGILGGGGPGGIAIGGLVAMVTGLGAAFSSAAKEADALAKETAANSKALGDYIQQIGTLRGMASQRFATYSQSQADQKRFAAGQASGTEYAAEVEALKKFVAQNTVDPKKIEEAIAHGNREMAQQLKMQDNASRLEAAYKSGDRELVLKLAEIQRALLEAPGKIAEYERLGRKARSDEVENARLAKEGKQAKSEQDAYLEEHGMPSDKRGTGPQRNAFARANPDVDGYKGDNILWEQREAQTRAAIAAIDKMQAEARQKETARVEAEQKAQFTREFADKKDQIEQLQQQFRAAEINKTALLTTSLDEQKAAYEQKISETLATIHTNDGEQAVQVEILKREAYRETFDEYMKLEEQKAAQVQAQIAQEKRDKQMMTQSLMALGTTAAQLTAKQLSEAVKGHKIQGAMILESLGDSMVAEGVRVMFQGAAMSLMGNFASGGGLLALGAAEMAVGLGLGAAGSAMQPPTASAGAAPQAGGSSPIRDTSASSNGDSGRGPTVIYIDMPTVVSPSPEDGLRIRQAIDAASRVYGAPV